MTEEAKAEAIAAFKAHVDAHGYASAYRQALMPNTDKPFDFWTALDAVEAEEAAPVAAPTPPWVEYLVWFHARQHDARGELPLVGEPAGFAENYPIFGDLLAYRYRVPDADLQQFLAACEVLDAVALYVAVNREISRERLERIAELAGHTPAQVEALVQTASVIPWLRSANDAEIAEWVWRCYALG